MFSNFVAVVTIARKISLCSKTKDYCFLTISVSSSFLQKMILSAVIIKLHCFTLSFEKHFCLRTFTGVETAALTFTTNQYSTGYSNHICYGKRFYNDFFLNHHTIALVHNCLKLLSCVVNIETDFFSFRPKQSILTVSFQLENAHLTSSRTVLNAMIAMHVHRQL